MKRINAVILTVFFVLTSTFLVPSGAATWQSEEDVVPTAKSITPVDPALLKGAVPGFTRAIGDVITVSIDSSGFPTIVLTLTVQRSTGEPVTGLTLNDFQVTEQSDQEDEPTFETIDSVNEALESSGVSLGLVFDLSGSMLLNGRIDVAKQDALCLLNAMGSNDRTMLMSFSGPDSALEVLSPGPFTRDGDKNGQYDIIEAINGLSTTKGFSTAIYDALAEAINAMAAEAQPKGIVLFTDGLSNNDNTYDINNVIQMATNADIPVATVIYGNENQQSDNLATGTGGVALDGPACQDMSGLYNSYTTGMTSTYTITYTSHNPLEDGTNRTVNVTYDGVSGTATYTVSGTTPVNPGQCSKNCDGGTGCFIQTTGGMNFTGFRHFLAFLFALLVAGGLVFLSRRFSRKQNITFLLAVLFLIASGMANNPARAGLRKGAFSISPMAGLYYFDDDQEIEKDPVAGIGLGYQFADDWGVEFMLNHGRYDYHYLVAGQCLCGTDDVSADWGRVDLLYHLWPEKDLVPYLAVGLGGIRLDFDNFDTENDSFADYGGGIQYFLSEDIALRADIRGIHTFDDSNNNLAATVGVTFLLGGKQKTCTTAKSEARPLVPATPVEKGPTPAAPVMAARPADFSVLFDFNKSDINPVYDNNFKQVADYLKAYKQIVLRIEGYTDAVGSKAYNQALSLRRAESVSSYLSTKFNISQTRLYVVGFGERKPVADNSTKEGRRLNRRAELHYMLPAAIPPEVNFDIRFPFDKSDIKPVYDNNFKQVADYLNNNNEIVLGIEGNTDTSGPQSYNQDLSMRRALNAGNYLSTRFHIPYTQMQFVGLGESNPAADNSTLEGRRLNRRVDLKCFKAAE